MPKIPKPKLKRIEFEIETLLGRREKVVGYVIIPGVAVHGTSIGWRVSHTVSGWDLTLSGINSFKTRREALAYVRKLVKVFPSVDWTKSSESIDRQVTEAIKKRFKILPKGGRYAAIAKMMGIENA